MLATNDSSRRKRHLQKATRREKAPWPGGTGATELYNFSRTKALNFSPVATDASGSRAEAEDMVGAGGGGAEEGGRGEDVTKGRAHRREGKSSLGCLGDGDGGRSLAGAHFSFGSY